MKLATFITTLKKAVGRDSVLEDLRLTRTELTDVTRSILKQSDKTLRNRRLTAPEVQQLERTFASGVKHKTGRMFETIQTTVNEAIDVSQELEDLLERSLATEVSREGLTYQQAQLLQLNDILMFFTRYTRRLLTYIFVFETNATGAGTPSADQPASDRGMLEADIEYIEQNFVSYCSAINTIHLASTNLAKTIAEIPDVIITSDNLHTLPGQVGEAKVDPLRAGFIPVSVNPFLFLGKLRAEHQVANYKEAQNELTTLQLRRMNLELINQDKPDARLQKQIEYNDNEVRKLTAKLADMKEELYG